jgi:hypothetical protein
MKGRADKTLVTFTSGEWAPELHGRTDLEKSATAGRTIKNMIVMQYGALARRPGLIFVAVVTPDDGSS